MNILVTGSEGFLGKHVVKKLVALGHTVVGVDNLEPRVHGEHAARGGHTDQPCDS